MIVCPVILIAIGIVVVYSYSSILTQNPMRAFMIGRIEGCLGQLWSSLFIVKNGADLNKLMTEVSSRINEPASVTRSRY